MKYAKEYTQILKERADDKIISDAETPLTDAAAGYGWSGDAVCVDVDFARKLELRLNIAMIALSAIRDRGQGSCDECEACNKIANNAFDQIERIKME